MEAAQLALQWLAASATTIASIIRNFVVLVLVSVLPILLFIELPGLAYGQGLQCRESCRSCSDDTNQY